MKGKKGMELSINFLVGLIIGIVLLALGLSFIVSIISGVKEVQRGAVPNWMEIEAEACSNRAETVCVPEVKKTTETTKPVNFGTVINNIYGETLEFTEYVSFSGAYDTNNQPINVNTLTIDDWTLPMTNINIENNVYEILMVPIQPPKNAEQGTYIFNIDVCFSPSSDPGSRSCPGHAGYLYDNTHQVTVVVK